MNKLFFLLLISLTTSSILYNQNVYIKLVSTNYSEVPEEDIKETFYSIVDEHNSYFYFDLILLKEKEIDVKSLENNKVLSSNFVIKVYDILSDKNISVRTFKLTNTGNQINVLKGLRNKKKQINEYLTSLHNENKIYSCDQIESKINNLIQIKDYKLAMHLAIIAPAECNTEQSKLKIYNTYQEEYCDYHLNNAKTYLAINDFSNVIKEIIKISPNSKCKQELLLIAEKMKNNYVEEDDKNYQLYLKYLESKEAESSYNLNHMLTVLSINDLMK